MPEGHTIHRAARDHHRIFAGKQLTISSPQGRFAEVYINDEYNGTYNITQKVEESDNRVPLGDVGYLLELDQLSRLDFDDVYFDSVITDKFLVNIKEPNLDLNSSEYVYIKTLINDF